MSEAFGPLNAYQGWYRGNKVTLSFQLELPQDGPDTIKKVEERFWLDRAEITKEEAQAIYREMQEILIDRGNYG